MASDEVTAAEVQEFQRRAADLARDYPELPGVAAKLEARGFDAHKTLTAYVIKQGMPELLLWLDSKEGTNDAHAVLNVKDSATRTRFELDRIAGRLKRQGFGQRYEAPKSREDRYIEQRRAEKRRVR
jgi:hypothetical protein